MEFFFNTYAFSLIFFGSITLLLSFYILKNERGAVRWVGLVMLSNSIWSVAYGFELASSNADQMKFFVNIEYLGITTLPVIWFLYCMELVEKDQWFKKTSNKLLISVIPVLTLLLVWTNDFHHIHYEQISIDRSGDFPMLALVPGPSFRIFTLFFYCLLLIGSYLLIVKFRKSDAAYRKQNYIVMIAAFIPWAANISYMAGLRPLTHLDLTPYAFLLSSILLFIWIYNMKLFDILPVARKKILDLMQDGFVVLDQQKRIIDYNAAFIYYTGIKTQKIAGKKLEEVLKDQPLLLALVSQHYSGKHPLFINTVTGTTEMEADVRILEEHRPDHSAMIIKLQDITELRKEAVKSQQQTEELKTLNALKDRIFSIMAHDLRGPLLNLSEVLKMVNDNTISIEEFKMLSPTLNKDIAYTADLLENILHWSRSQLNGYGINIEVFDLKKLINDEVTYHLPSANSKKITVIQDIPDDTTAYADMLMMQIVLRNLITNAIKFCKETCLIEIFIQEGTEDFVSICLRDNGVGMSAETAERLFRGENISSRGTQNEKGTGLGLMVCRDFMERNGGTIAMESKLGLGTSFCLNIPIAEKK